MDESMYASDVEEETQICRFKMSSKLKKRAPVFIADFEHSRVKKNERNVLQFASFKSDADRDKIEYDARRSFLARSNHTDFTGFIPNDAHHLRKFVGVRNKKTGKMKLYDSVLFRMKPILKSADIDVSAELPKAKTYWEGEHDLTQNFGVKAKKRAMSAHLKHAANSSIDEEALNVSDLSISATPDRPVLQFGLQNLTYLPTIHREAGTVDQVFDINDIITPEEDSILEDEARLIVSDGEKLSELRSRSCKYVYSHLKHLHNDVEKAKYLIYFNYLVSFQHLKYADVNRKDPANAIPQPFRQRLLDNFTTTSKNANSGRIARQFPTLMKDKIVAYILVLALFIDDFTVNTNHVLNDLNAVGFPKFTMISHAIGCHIKSQKVGDETVKFAELKLPLFVLMPKLVKKKVAASSKA